MKLKNIWLLSVLIVLLFSVACGSGDEDGKNNRNNKQDTGNVEADAGETDTDTVDDKLKDVDVLANGKNNSPEQALEFEVGQSVGGALKASAGGENDFDVQMFKVELAAGTVLEFEFSALGDGFETEEYGPLAVAAFEDENERLVRYLVSGEGLKRQVFIPYTGTYYISVSDERAGFEAHGGSDSYYIMRTGLVDLKVEDVTAPAALEGDINDSKVRAFKMKAGEAGIAVAQAFGWDPPEDEEDLDWNYLDPALFVWDPVANKLLAHNEDIAADYGDYDAELAFKVEKDSTYVVILDAFENAKPAEYEFYLSIEDDHPDIPGILTLGEESTGGIAAAVDGITDTDFFVVEVQGGQTVRVEITGVDQLQPVIEVEDDELYYVGGALPVGNQAAIEFTRPVGEDAARYMIYIEDRRNVQLVEEDVIEAVGGPAFGYKIKATVSEIDAVASTFPLSESIVLDKVGTTKWYEVTVPANHIVQFHTTTTAADFEPNVGFFDKEKGYEWFEDSPNTYISGNKESKIIFGVRDAFFRGGAAYTIDFEMNTYDLSGITYTPVADIAENVSVATAQAVALPVEISGTLKGESKVKLDADYFKLSLVEDTALVVRAHSEKVTDMIVRLIKSDGTTTAIKNDYYLGQEKTFFSAFAYEVDEAGDYTLEIAPYCDEVSEGGCKGNGDYTLKAFTLDL